MSCGKKFSHQRIYVVLNISKRGGHCWFLSSKDKCHGHHELFVSRAYRLPPPALYAVPLHCPPRDFFRNNTGACRARISRERKNRKGKQSPVPAPPPFVIQISKISPRHAPKSKHLRWREARAPLSASANEYPLAARTALPCEEAVCCSAFSLLWLIESFHGGTIPLFFLCINENSQSLVEKSLSPPCPHDVNIRRRNTRTLLPLRHAYNTRACYSQHYFI